MLSVNLLLSSLLLNTAFASSSGQGGWKNGPKATGETDPNVTKNCGFWANDVKSTDTCKMVEDYFGITLKQLVAWNPELQYDYCVLVPGFSYCVSGPAIATSSSTVTAPPAGTITYSGTAAPTQSGLAKSCTKYHLVKKGDTCYTIQDKYMDFTLQQFYSWNPSIHQGCKGLAVGDYVCVAAKTSPTSTSSSSSSSWFPTQTGTTPRCNKWHFVTGDDNCTSIRDEYGITPAEFYHWNPATGKNCTNLWRKVYVCVGVTDSSSSTNTTMSGMSQTRSTATADSATPTATSSIQSAMGPN